MLAPGPEASSFPLLPGPSLSLSLLFLSCSVSISFLGLSSVEGSCGRGQGGRPRWSVPRVQEGWTAVAPQTSLPVDPLHSHPYWTELFPVPAAFLGSAYCAFLGMLLTLLGCFFLGSLKRHIASLASSGLEALTMQVLSR